MGGCARLARLRPQGTLGLKKGGVVKSRDPEAISADIGKLAREHERAWAVLASLAEQFTVPVDFETAMAACLDAVMEVNGGTAGAALHLVPASGEVVHGIERGLSVNFVSRFILPETLLRLEQSPSSARHPAFRNCSHSDLSGDALGPPVPFRVAVLPLLWDEGLKGLLASAGSCDRADNVLVLEALQSLAAASLSMSERFDVVARGKKEWEKAFDSLDDVIFVTDMNGRIRRANLGAASSVGMDIRQLVGSLCEETLHEKFCQSRPCLLPQVIEGRGTTVLDVNPAGQTWHRLTLYPIRGPDGTLLGALHWIVDVTEIKQLEQAARETEILLMERHRRESIERLIDALAHDLKNPLTYLMTTASRLQASHPEIDDLRLMVGQASRTRDMLDNFVQKSGTGRQRASTSVDLNEVLLAELTHLESDPFFDPEIERQVDLVPNVPKIEGIRADFSTSFANILVNALHAMWNRKERRLVVSTYADDEAITVEIEDTGTGIEPEDLSRIFEPFYTTKPSRPSAGGAPLGTGLGLASVKMLLRPYGAEVDVQSEPGEGTRFSVRIPFGQGQQGDRISARTRPSLSGEKEAPK